jgi:D-serine deaminase-like pyridoxal phosphate-dependent protein
MFLSKSRAVPIEQIVSGGYNMIFFKKNRRSLILVSALIVATLVIIILKPSDQGASYDPYFAALNGELKKNGPGRPVIIVDMDRLDKNIVLLKASVKPPLSYRLVVKSLPSMPMVKYIMQKTGTKKLMVFHQPDLSLLAAQGFRDVDILLGKPMPLNAVREFYSTAPRTTGFDPARQVQWLIDTPERMKQYLALATEKNLTMRCNIEIDVGLHRGGVTNINDLDAMLKIISNGAGRLKFSGYMGYEPHVASALPILKKKETAVREAYAGMVARYREFYDFGKKTYPELFTGDLTFNSGGSHTYRLFQGEGPVNDVAVGSGLVKPSDFDTLLLTDHLPALMVAAPVLKRLDGTTVPFLEKISWIFPLWNPNKQVTYFLYGGGWRANSYSPKGLEDNSFFGLSTNQSIANGSRKTGLDVDDYIFLRPTQSEAIMREFGDIVLVRGGKIVDRWPSFPQ